MTLGMKNECGGEGLVLTRKLVEDEMAGEADTRASQALGTLYVILC